MWHGALQWQIEALWRFQIPADMRARYGYPELTDQVKRQILGLNSARLYGLDPTTSQYTPVPADFEARMPDHLKKLLGMCDAECEDQIDRRRLRRAPGSSRGSDTITRAKAEYEELGAEPSHLRYGWVNRSEEA